MNKRVISILISGVMIISSINHLPLGEVFALEPDLSQEEVAAEAKYASDSDTASDDSADSTNYIDSYIADEPDYVKVASFGELPEDVVYQEVKSGTALEEIIFPDTLQIDVVPDTDRDERIRRKLGEEREARKRADDNLEAVEEGEYDDVTEDEEDSQEDSSDPDEEEIIFFDSDTGESSTGIIEEGDEEDISFGEDIDSSETPEEPETTVKPEEPAASKEPSEEPSDKNSATPEAQDTQDAPAKDASDTNSDGDNNSDGDIIIGRIRSALMPLTVYAAEESAEPVGSDTQEDTDAGDETDEATESEGNAAEDAAEDDGISHEMVSDVKWVVDYEQCGIDTYDPDLIGMEYVFTPILLLPDFYYIEAELPTITVKIVEEYFVFDKTVDVDGVRIRVRADKGVFPEDAEIFAEKLEDEDQDQVDEAISEVSEDTGLVVKSYSFDIQIKDED
jgi:hypothetical protein